MLCQLSYRAPHSLRGRVKAGNGKDVQSLQCVQGCTVLFTWPVLEQPSNSTLLWVKGCPAAGTRAADFGPHALLVNDQGQGGPCTWHAPHGLPKSIPRNQARPQPKAHTRASDFGSLNWSMIRAREDNSTWHAADALLQCMPKPKAKLQIRAHTRDLFHIPYIIYIIL